MFWPIVRFLRVSILSWKSCNTSRRLGLYWWTSTVGVHQGLEQEEWKYLGAGELLTKEWSSHYLQDVSLNMPHVLDLFDLQ